MTEKATQPRPDRVEPKGGTIIADRYQVDRLIARGGMAAVYLAHHVKLNRPVALKILSPPPDAEDPESFEERFRLEAETLASLDHPNIVILHDFGETTDGRFFLAMEFVDGPRLSDLLRDGPLPVERALNLIMQVCAALRYAHKRGVVHRDLKPSNMLVRPKDNGEEQVKVVDFGLVKLTEADQSITRAGLILGSPHCMAPEQIKGQDVDLRTDVYAVGILLFRTLTGQYPFHGPNSAATMIAHLNQPVPTFYSIAPDLVVPAGLEEIVRRCLEKKLDDRFADMQSLMNELAGCMNVPPEQFRSVSQTSSSIQRAIAEPGSSSRLLLVAGAGVLVLLMLLVVGLGGVGLIWRNSGQPAVGDATTSVMPPPIVPPPAVPPVLELPVVEVPPTTTPPGTPENPEATVATTAPPPVEVKPPPTRKPRSTHPKAETKAQPLPPATTDPKDKEPPGYMGLPDDFK